MYTKDHKLLMKIKLKLLICFLTTFTCITAQTNVDSLFNKAIEKSHLQKYQDAISDIKKTVIADSSRTDINIFLANLYLWSEKKDSALACIEKVKSRNELNDDFFDAYLNILLSSKKHFELIDACNLAEQRKYSNKLNLITKRILAFEGTGDYESGIKLVNKVENKHFLTDETVSELYNNLVFKNCKQTIAANYSLDIFNTIKAQHLASLSYSFKADKHSVELSTNYANRFGFNDVQIESTAYLTTNTKQYLYLNYGYAINASLFPQHRSGLEYYFPIVTKWDGSLGGRYMYYKNTINKNVVILTGHIGTYFENMWISIRPFYVIKKDLRSVSLVSRYRLYEKNSRNYWGAELGFGNSPDDMFAASQSSFNELMSYKIKLEKNLIIDRTSDIYFGLSYINEQIHQGTIIGNRNRYTFEIGYKYRF